MDILQWQKIDKNQFAIFIRDISRNLSNVKYMIEDYTIKQLKNKPTKHKKKKKKDIIIEEQTKIRHEKKIKEDFSSLDYIMDTINKENPYQSFSLMKTEEGLVELKFRMLDYYWKVRKDYFPHVMNLYFQVIDKPIPDEHHKLIINKMKSKLDDYEYKLYMMKYLSHLLPPLNIHEPRTKGLDDWQIKVVQWIKQGESVIVKAPTSSGKSFIALSAGVFHKKILYVCPAKPIAYQVGAHYNMMGYKVHYLLDNLCYQSYDDKTNIFIGVPSVIEDNLYKLGISFDYAVFDEIHNLNKKDDGHNYENILKLIECPFLALSATIGNIEYLQKVFESIHEKKVNYIEYTKRFINQQKMVYQNGKLEKVHPLVCIQMEDLTSSFLDKNLQFTPYDSAILWETIEEVFENGGPYGDTFDEMLESCSPDNYFNETHSILTLDDTRDYEYFIKQKLIELSKTHSDEIKEILSRFHATHSILRKSESIKDIIQLFIQCKRNECLPMLAFNTDTNACKDLFTELFTCIANEESINFPYHYKILEYKDELYSKYEDERKVFIDNIKITKDSKDAKTDKQCKIDKYDRRCQQKYIQDISGYYESCIHNCGRVDSVTDELKEIQIKHLKKELKRWIRNPSFNHVDIFQKHTDYCFTNTNPMSGEQIKSIRREIQKTLGIKISYEHELFQMLKRGIGIYTETMPDEYKWILQKLMNDKKIGIVISDRTLCLGIDLPMRSSLLVGLPGKKCFTIDDYLQMSGRAGRRGKDDRGNTIFYNLDYKRLMKGHLPDIVGTDKEVPNNYQIFNSCIDKVYKHSINPNKIIDTRGFVSTKLPKLHWYLRYEDNVSEFINDIDRWNKDVYMEVDGLSTELLILHKILSMMKCDTDKLIEEYKKKVILTQYNECIQMIRMLEIIYNELKDKKYSSLKTDITKVYNTFKQMILHYQKLN